MKAVMKPIKAKEYKRKLIISFDIETEGKENKLTLACFKCKQRPEFNATFTNKEDIKQYLANNDLRNAVFYATNLPFDFLGLFYDCPERWSLSERMGSVYWFKWFQSVNDEGYSEHPLLFLDTIKVMPFSVQKLGELVGAPKLEHPSCFARHPENTKEWAELEKYCQQDTEVTLKAVEDILVPFIEKYNLKLKPTIGGLALQDFRTNHQTFPIFQESLEKQEMARDSYYGGRTEIFRRGGFQNVYCFDINSLYPSAMLNELPNPNRSHLIKKGNIKNINKYEGCSEVLVDVPLNLFVPPLPYRKDNKLIFPVGTFKGTYNHNELRYAVECGVRIISVSKQLIYPKTYPFFRSFVEQHYKERLRLQKEGSPLEVMEKLLMNNLYGKFAFDWRNTSSLIPVQDLDYDKHIVKSGMIKTYQSKGFVSIDCVDPKPPIYSIPIFSSYIASISRINMGKYLQKPEIQTKLIYTDTDSIFLYDYKDEIETSDKLGDMKLEKGYPVKKLNIFIKPKQYLSAKAKCKGLKLKSEDDFHRIIKGESIKQERFTKLRTAVASTENSKYGLLKPNQIIEIEKHIDLEDTKRNWRNRFNPFVQEKSKPIILSLDDKNKEIEIKQVVDNAAETIYSTN